MGERISRSAEGLAGQCRLAETAIGGEPEWPAPAPTAADVHACAANLAAQLALINGLESQLRAARQALAPLIQQAHDVMARVDRATDLLYGPKSASKIAFGLAPKKAAARGGTVAQAVIRGMGDGARPGAIHIDWDSVTGAAYEVQWFHDAGLEQPAGSSAVTASETEVDGLVPGQQYWFRVRAVRGGRTGPWSDPATRIANL